MPEPTERWHVYQFRSDTDLLYVGHTRWLKTRLAEHRRDKPWWSEVTEVKSEEFATEDEARQREKELWAAVRPKYNKMSPFRTLEEKRQGHREWVQRPENQERLREYHRKYMQGYKPSPEQLERWRRNNAEYARRRRATGAGKRWRQTGPGLF